jgi:quercetin dioxygenase-like cupin family protein
MNALARGPVALVLSLSFPLAALAQGGAKPAPAKPMAKPAMHHIVPAASVKFSPFEVPGFPSGIELAAIHGDPNAASGAYVVRLKFPDGYKFPAHWHPNAENLTVLEGELLLAMGGKEGAATPEAYPAGTFIFIPGKSPHYGGAKGATVIQLHGQAPFKIMLANAAAKPTP